MYEEADGPTLAAARFAAGGPRSPLPSEGESSCAQPREAGDVELYSPDYETVETSESWNGFLGDYYGVGEDVIAAFTQPEPDVEIGKDGTVTLTAAYDPAAQENLTEATISPEVANYDAQGNEVWYATSEVGLYADLENITYEFVPLPSGTELQMDLALHDFGGNVSYSTTSVVVP